ncbi:ankyrin repeat-containing protein [Fusarium globosum]|uniref:Ankyrin repeat-containing protein n=1 Tax=Fusarium globosum TaxID=78864 RepID=A0A8H5Y5E0_9HYPO|nr:ankyrin repeat-containing protein [Fusarium globosum]
MANSQQRVIPDENLEGTVQAIELDLGALDYLLGIPENVSSNGATPRITRAEWDRHKEVIVAMYPYKTLPDLMKHMTNVYTFSASKQQWKKKLREWNLSKNLSHQVARFVGKRGQSRHRVGKKTKFHLRGEPVPIDKVQRHMQAYENPSKSQTGSTPDGLTYTTIKSPTLARSNIPMPSQTAPVSAPQDPVLMASPQAPFIQPHVGAGMDQVQMAFWNGRDLDDLLKDVRNASQLAMNGDYMTAKPIFMECLDGLEVVLAPTHATFMSVLQQYVSFAVSNKDFDEATARVHKSYNDHKQRLGSHDKKVWQCLERLGLLYYERGLASQAYHMLVNARQGLLVATSGKVEESYNCVLRTVKAIISISIKHHDFGEAERELLNLIAQAESLGAAYQDDALSHKHDLVHLYHDNWSRSKHTYGHTPPNRNQTERFLLEIIHFKSMSQEVTHMQTCSWDKLRDFYETTGQRDKLEQLLPKLEDVLSKVGFLSPSNESLLVFKQNMINSFSALGQYEKAEWWLLRIRDEAEHYSFDRVSLNMRLANLYFEMEKSEDGLAMLKEAQSIGKDILPEDHTFHSVVVQSISDRKVSGGCCPECHVNPPGKNRKLESPIHELIGSESEVDYPMQSVLPEADDEQDDRGDHDDHDEQDGQDEEEGFDSE